MAATRSAKYPHRWPNGTYHSIPYNQHQQNTGGGTVAIGNKPVTVGQWQSGALLNAMVPPGPAGANNPAAVTAGDIPTPGKCRSRRTRSTNAERGLAGTRRTNTLAGLTQQRTSGLTNYGFTEAPGTGALAFDPNNPFSRASLLKKNYDISRARTGGQMASGGQLYAGVYQTAQDTLNRGQVGDEDTLQKSLGECS